MSPENRAALSQTISASTFNCCRNTTNYYAVVIGVIIDCRVDRYNLYAVVIGVIIDCRVDRYFVVELTDTIIN